MITFGYWDIRGLAHAIRMLLEYTKTPYEEKIYVTGEAPNYDRSQWLDEKEKLGLDFPNLPYLIDGDVKLTQSNTILRYISRKHGLAGESESEKNNVSLIENQAMDFRMGLVTIAYNSQFTIAGIPTDIDFAGFAITLAGFLKGNVQERKEVILVAPVSQKILIYRDHKEGSHSSQTFSHREVLKGPYLEKLPVALGRFSHFLGDRHWFAGDKLTFADFLMYDVLDQHRMLDPNCLQKYSNLQDFLSRFEALPPIAAYMKSPRFMKTPINNRMAFWANKK